MNVPISLNWPLLEKEKRLRIIRGCLMPVEHLLTLTGGLITFATIILFAVRDKVRVLRLDTFKGSGRPCEDKQVLRTYPPQHQNSVGSGGDPHVDIKGKGAPEVTLEAQIVDVLLRGNQPESARPPTATPPKCPSTTTGNKYLREGVWLEDQPGCASPPPWEEVLEVKCDEAGTSETPVDTVTEPKPSTSEEGTVTSVEQPKVQDTLELPVGKKP